MSSHYGDVIGRSLSQLKELGNSIVGDSSDAEHHTVPFRRATTKEPAPKLLLDAAEEITPNFSHSLQDDADKKLWKGVWSRVGPRIAQQHFFASPSEADEDLIERFAEVVKRLNLVSNDVLNTFVDSVMRSGVNEELIPLWKFLASVIPDDEEHLMAMDPSQGARHFFEERFLDHVLKTAVELRLSTGRQSDAIRVYVQQKKESNDSVYPTWMLIYYAIRCGDYRSATEFAANAFFPEGCRCESPEFYLRSFMQRPLHFSKLQFDELDNACEQFLRYGARKKLSSEYRYMLMSVAFLSGQISAADRLISESAQSWDSLDEFLWFTLGCVRPLNDSTKRFDFKKLRSRLSSFEERYYTENGKRPLRFALVLFAGLQFGSALHYMLTQDAGRGYAIHVVHMAIALQKHGLLDIADVSDPKQIKRDNVADLVLQYGRSLAVTHSHLAWHYYYLALTIDADDANQPSESDIATYLSDLLMRSRDANLLTHGGAFGSYVADSDKRKRIFELGAESSLNQRQYEIAIELYKAADRQDKALESCNKMAAHLLGICASLDSAVYPFEHREKILEVNRVFAYVEKDLEQENEQTRVLAMIAEFLEADQRQEHSRAVNKIHMFPFMPRTEEDVESMVNILTKSFPEVVPLMSSVIHIFCKNAKKLDWQSTTPDNRARLLKRFDVLQTFVRKIPFPFTDVNRAFKELETTANELKGYA